MYTDADTFDGTDLSPVLLPNSGFLPVVNRFPYLGDVIARDGSDAAAVDARIESGCKAFGALRGCIFSSSSISAEAKRAVYEAIVLSIALYGCETWSLTEELADRLRCMYARTCVPCVASRAHTRGLTTSQPRSLGSGSGFTRWTRTYTDGNYAGWGT